MELYIRARSLGSAAPLLRGVENAALRLSFALAKEGARKAHHPALLGARTPVELMQCWCHAVGDLQSLARGALCLIPNFIRRPAVQD